MPSRCWDSLEGEARDVGREHAARALAAKQRGERVAILSGGEFTVTVKGNGAGGPNQEYALGLAIGLGGASALPPLRVIRTELTGVAAMRMTRPAPSFWKIPLHGRQRGNSMPPPSWRTTILRDSLERSAT